MTNNIKIAREKTNMTQKECADKLGITLRAWQTYEQGVSEPKNELLCNIADMFSVSIDYLLGRSKREQTTIDKLASEFNMSTFEKKIFEGYVNLPKEMRSDLMEFLHKAVADTMAESSDIEICSEKCSKLEEDARSPQEKDAV